MSSEERSQEQKQKAGEIKLVRPFVDALADVADFRQRPQYELKIVLTVIVLGLLCGQNSERRIAVWAQRMPLSLRRRLKLPHLRVPSRATIQRTVAEVNSDSLVQAWHRWVEEALMGWLPPDMLQGLAIDGKTLRGSADHPSGTAALELLGAMVHDLGVMLANQPIPAATSESGALRNVPVGQPFLESLLLDGRVITLSLIPLLVPRIGTRIAGDAAHTSQATEQTIVQKGGTTSCG